MEALRNKKTGRLLVLDVQAEKGWERGIIDEAEVIRKHIELRDSEYSGVVFCVNEPGIIDDLLKNGKCTYPEIKIEFYSGYGNSFSIADLERVTLREQNAN